MNFLFETDSFENFKDATNEILSNLYSPLQSESNKHQAAKEELKHILSSNNFNIEESIQQIQSKEWDAERIRFFESELNKRKAEILYFAIINYNTNFGECLTDHDWSLKLVLGTNGLNSLRYPILQLVLKTINSKNINNTMYDITKDVLLKLIETLESIE